MSIPTPPPTAQTIALPARPGTPLEPLRPERRRGSLLAAGALGIVSGALLLTYVGQAGVWLAPAGPPDVDQLIYPAAMLLLAVTGAVVACLAAPGSVVRRVLGALVMVAGAIAAMAYQASLYRQLVPFDAQLSWVITPLTVLLGFGVLGWLLASGARALAFLVLLLTPLPAVAETGARLAGIGGGLVFALIGPLALVIAVLALVVSRRRRR
ncbi:hypothetical protein [Agrococcus sp. SGAir0287]|uniref:hypothetical protein n=1 Tax=Agrococcus sp. SGAir0287 TaxID=2070347 RepID=UPI0010CCF4EB|nr:hypothetical protein [Agrococcus sp. SGAir0287]QCR19839.1 hypothetical protein C1N71_10695 [Agrococcus sp. SGAir0287]